MLRDLSAGQLTWRFDSQNNYARRGAGIRAYRLTVVRKQLLRDIYDRKQSSLYIAEQILAYAKLLAWARSEDYARLSVEALLKHHPRRDDLEDYILLCDCGHYELRDVATISWQDSSECRKCNNFIYSRVMDAYVDPDSRYTVPIYDDCDCAVIVDYADSIWLSDNVSIHDLLFCAEENAWMTERAYWGYCDTHDVYDDADESYNYQHINSYHSSRREFEPMPSDPWRKSLPLDLGVELEVECDTSQTKRHLDETAGVLKERAIDTLGKQVITIEQDSSLDFGFEIITSPGGLEAHRKLWKGLLASIPSTFGSDDYTSTGLHVHIDRAGMTPLHRGKLLVFVNRPENRDLVYAVARRYDVSYCKIKKEVAVTDGSAGTSRYEAVNFDTSTRGRTIEFRIFKGTLNYNRIMAALEFTRAAWLFARDTSIEQLTTEAFIAFINTPHMRKETLALRPLLDKAGFANVFVPVPVPLAA